MNQSAMTGPTFRLPYFSPPPKRGRCMPVAVVSEWPLDFEADGSEFSIYVPDLVFSIRGWFNGLRCWIIRNLTLTYLD